MRAPEVLARPDPEPRATHATRRQPTDPPGTAGKSGAGGARRKGRRPHARRGLEFVAWGAVAGRSQELADALGGRARCIFPPGGRRPPVLVRWAVSALVTIVHVVVRRPAVLVVTDPPVPAALVGWAVGRALGARVVLDSHPGAFGAQGDRVAAALQPLHRWVTRRADLSIVASERFADLVESWGADAVVVHEAPGDWELRPVPARARPRVLYVGRFAADEPWQAVLAAAAAVPEVDVVVTGDHRRAGLDAASVPENVELVGFLDAPRYRQAVYDASAVVTLTTEPGSIMRAACEAVWAGRPLLVSDWPALRDVFPYALVARNDSASLAEGLRLLAADPTERASFAPAARALQARRFAAQRQSLARRLGIALRAATDDTDAPSVHGR